MPAATRPSILKKVMIYICVSHAQGDLSENVSPPCGSLLFWAWTLPFPYRNSRYGRKIPRSSWFWKVFLAREPPNPPFFSDMSDNDRSEMSEICSGNGRAWARQVCTCRPALTRRGHCTRVRDRAAAKPYRMVAPSHLLAINPPNARRP
jgi:hypothetical protein